MNALEKLVALHDYAKNENTVKHRRLYDMLLDKNLLVMAYETIKSKNGSTSVASDGTTMDGISISIIDSIVKDLKDMSFKPTPVRMTGIPKADGKIRYLGIGERKDRIVQQAMKMILEAIYEPVFSDLSHGFRPNRSCHSAMKIVRERWQGTSWVVEGDIKGFFDNIDHHKLVGCLKRRIDDTWFIDLVWKFLRAGKCVSNGKLSRQFQYEITRIGTPQGGVLSPVLANIYLHDFDMLVEKVCEKYGDVGSRRSTKRKTTFSNAYLEADKVVRKCKESLKLMDAGKPRETGIHSGLSRQELVDMFRKAKKARMKVACGGQSRKVQYIRYADDFMISVTGNRKLAEKIKAICGRWLALNCKLELSETKTLITHCSGDTKFLGYKISFRSGWIKKGKRVGQGRPVLNADISKVLKRLKDRGFCKGNGDGLRYGSLIRRPEVNIVDTYNSLMTGIFNHFSFVDNRASLGWIEWILRSSCYKTICAKRNVSSTRTLLKKYGADLSGLSAEGRHGGENIKLNIMDSFAKDSSNFMIGDLTPYEEVIDKAWKRGKKSFLRYSKCSVCDAKGDIELHHVKAIRGYGALKGNITKIMAADNRRQLPVCRMCHMDIHNGLYDDAKLSDVYWAFWNSRWSRGEKGVSKGILSQNGDDDNVCMKKDNISLNGHTLDGLYKKTFGCDIIGYDSRKYVLKGLNIGKIL